MVREAECSRCKHVWYAIVEYGEYTTNLSGEKTVYCPICGKRATYLSPWINPHWTNPETNKEEDC